MAYRLSKIGNYVIVTIDPGNARSSPESKASDLLYPFLLPHSGNISNVFAQLKVTNYPRLMSHKLIDNGPQALKMVNNPKESHDSGGRCLH